MNPDQTRSQKPAAEPGSASAEDGVVLLDGPRGIAVSMTPEAAKKTGDSLKEAAAEAQQQAATGLGIKTGPIST